MQYILTEQEYEKLISRPIVGDLVERDEALSILRRKLLTASNFHCIYNRPSLNDYCDHCPCVDVQDHKVQYHMCSLDKEWSK